VPHGLLPNHRPSADSTHRLPSKVVKYTVPSKYRPVSHPLRFLFPDMPSSFRSPPANDDSARPRCPADGLYAFCGLLLPRMRHVAGLSIAGWLISGFPATPARRRVPFVPPTTSVQLRVKGTNLGHTAAVGRRHLSESADDFSSFASPRKTRASHSTAHKEHPSA